MNSYKKGEDTATVVVVLLLILALVWLWKNHSASVDFKESTAGVTHVMSGDGGVDRAKQIEADVRTLKITRAEYVEQREDTKAR